jgi:uncharacterized protein YgiM (DUF1202 family)
MKHIRYGTGGVIFLLVALFALPVLAQTATGMVTAAQLNVRTTPDPIDGIAFTRVYEGQVYPVVGRDDTANWFEIRLPDGNTGWVSGAYFRVIDFSGVPVTHVGYVQGRVLAYRLNLRTAPDAGAQSLGTLSLGQTYRVLGRNGNANWYQLRLPSGLTGWASSRWLYVSDPAAVPVVGGTPLHTPSPTNTPQTVVTSGAVNGTVTTDELNVRTLPDPVQGVAFTRVYEGQVYHVIGRDETTTWFQIRLADGNVGWVSGAYLRVSDPAALPVTFTGYIQGTVSGASKLNVRSTPNPYISSNILTQISRGQTYRVLARSANGWYQLRLPSGLTGWVNGRYLDVTNPERLPITQ